MSLRGRIMIAFAYLLLVAVVALSVPLGVNVARRARDDFTVQLNNHVEATAARVPEAMARGQRALDALAAERMDLGRVIIIDADGHLMSDPAAGQKHGRDFTFRPEVVAALEGRTTRLVRPTPVVDAMYVIAVPVIDEGRVVGVVRINQHADEVDAVVRRRLLLLAAGSGVVLLMALLIAIAIGRSLTRPLRRLGEVAARIGEGHLGAQAPESGQREVAEVAVALNTMSRRIEQVVSAQTDFVANASHQLRTPLTGLRLRLEAMQAAEVAGADAALAETDRLAALVDDLLTLVRMGTTPLYPETTDLVVAAQGAVDRWAIPAADRSHVLKLQVPDGPSLVLAGITDIDIALDNLIENALKYTPDGTTVTVAVSPIEGGALLAVSDDGPGMTEQDRLRAFERFYRGTTGQAAKGTGLGLAIVRQVVERWGGTVAIHVQDGTCFEIYFPEADSGSAGNRDTTERIPTLS